LHMLAVQTMHSKNRYIMQFYILNVWKCDSLNVWKM